MVPILLHLRRRRVGRTIQVGSVKHLASLPSAERRGIRLRDPWLLLLRAAILAVLVLLLARLVLQRVTDPRRPFIVVDSLTPESVIGSLRGAGQVHIERLDDPWRRVQALDDSLPIGVPLLIAASTRSDLYQGPRPIVGRRMTWYPHDPTRDRPPAPRDGAPAAAALTPSERRALTAAVGASRELFGPLTDSAGWMGRLPLWWRDSIAVAAFPVAVARAVAPVGTSPMPVMLTAGQVTPRRGVRTTLPEHPLGLHWWLWGAVLLLFLAERGWVARRGSRP